METLGPRTFLPCRASAGAARGGRSIQVQDGQRGHWAGGDGLERGAEIMDSPKKAASKSALPLAWTRVGLQMEINLVLAPGSFRVDQEPKSTWSASFPSPAPLFLVPSRSSLLRARALSFLSTTARRIGWLTVLLLDPRLILWLCNTAGWFLLTTSRIHHEAGVVGPRRPCRRRLLHRHRRRAWAAPGSDPDHLRLCPPLGNFSSKRERVRIRSLPALLPVVEACQWVLPYVPIVNLVSTSRRRCPLAMHADLPVHCRRRRRRQDLRGRW